MFKAGGQMYEKRIIDEVLKDYLTDFPAILIEGAKAVGKTETCSHLAKTIYSMDNGATRLLLTGDPETILRAEPPVLIDEWQLAPELWNYVRHEIDKGLAPGSVLFTGSSIRVNARIHSGAGRIIRMKMRPYTVEERQMSEKYIRVADLLTMKVGEKISGQTDRNITDYVTEIFQSGFPGIRNKADRVRRIQLENYVHNIVEHEFEENGFALRQPASLMAWLKAYAASIATTTNFQTIIDAAMANNSETPSRPTANAYREALQILYIIADLPPFLPIGKLYPNLAKAPKHFMLDPAIALTLLDVSREQLENYQVPKHVGRFNKSLIGQLIESLVYQSLIVYAEANEAHLYHFRDSRGVKEIDFILQKRDTLILFEVKSDQEAKDKYVEHLNWFEGIAKEEFKIVKVLLNAGPYAYTRADGVHVIPIAMLGV